MSNYYTGTPPQTLPRNTHSTQAFKVVPQIITTTQACWKPSNFHFFLKIATVWRFTPVKRFLYLSVFNTLIYHIFSYLVEIKVVPLHFLLKLGVISVS